MRLTISDIVHILDQYNNKGYNFKVDYDEISLFRDKITIKIDDVGINTDRCALIQREIVKKAGVEPHRVIVQC